MKFLKPNDIIQSQARLMAKMVAANPVVKIAQKSQKELMKRALLSVATASVFMSSMMGSAQAMWDDPQQDPDARFASAAASSASGSRVDPALFASSKAGPTPQTFARTLDLTQKNFQAMLTQARITTPFIDSGEQREQQPTTRLEQLAAIAERLIGPSVDPRYLAARIYEPDADQAERYSGSDAWTSNAMTVYFNPLVDKMRQIHNKLGHKKEWNDALTGFASALFKISVRLTELQHQGFFQKKDGYYSSQYPFIRALRANMDSVLTRFDRFLNAKDTSNDAAFLDYLKEQSFYPKIIELINNAEKLVGLKKTLGVKKLGPLHRQSIDDSMISRDRTGDNAQKPPKKDKKSFHVSFGAPTLGDSDQDHQSVAKQIFTIEGTGKGKPTPPTKSNNRKKPSASVAPTVWELIAQSSTKTTVPPGTSTPLAASNSAQQILPTTPPIVKTNTPQQPSRTIMTAGGATYDDSTTTQPARSTTFKTISDDPIDIDYEWPKNIQDLPTAKLADVFQSLALSKASKAKDFMTQYNIVRILTAKIIADFKAGNVDSKEPLHSLKWLLSKLDARQKAKIVPDDREIRAFLSSIIQLPLNMQNSIFNALKSDSKLSSVVEPHIKTFVIE